MENYYENNKEYVISRMREKVICERCKKEITRSNIYSHMKTKRCKYIEDINKRNDIRYNIHSDTCDYIIMRLKQLHITI